MLKYREVNHTIELLEKTERFIKYLSLGIVIVAIGSIITIFLHKTILGISIFFIGIIIMMVATWIIQKKI
jgi:hypothetical protein